MEDASAVGDSEEILLKYVDIMLTICRHGKIIDFVMSTSTFYRTTWHDNLSHHVNLHFLLNRLGMIIYLSMSTSTFYLIDLA